MELMKSKHAVHRIAYHIVFCTKYRNKVLVGPIEVECRRIIGETCYKYNWKLVNTEVMPDHVHLLVQTDHTATPYIVVQTIKSVSAVYLFERFPSLKKNKFWGSGLWSPSTFYGSVGNVSEKVIRNYINNQYSS